MKSRGRRYVRGGFALLLGGAGVGLFLTRRMLLAKGGTDPAVRRDRARDRWARPGMEVTFRAELMPSRETFERTFRIAELLPSGRVRLEGFAGEHTESEFEPVR
ncbi:MAG: hypothetical protein LC785_16430 [Acidobacteria bacterium]|nr:hypothetical protein [Acidobacteriota bacterium]MCA1643491.1 hypothetical protein [Acidobacteriota bacterium]